jgi:curved DNA-binding protein CbpA
MTNPRPDPYVVLGVGHDASDDDLDRAFRGLVRQLHPDTREPSDTDTDTDTDTEADRRLQELLTAYASLRDPIRRAAYDRSRPAPPAPPYRAQSGAPTRAEPAIRVGPVHWKPPPRRSATTAD